MSETSAVRIAGVAQNAHEARGHLHFACVLIHTRRLCARTMVRESKVLDIDEIHK